MHGADATPTSRLGGLSRNACASRERAAYSVRRVFTPDASSSAFSSAARCAATGSARPSCPKRLALPVFASDALSSVAYAPDEILLTLGLAGGALRR